MQTYPQYSYQLPPDPQAQLASRLQQLEREKRDAARLQYIDKEIEEKVAQGLEKAKQELLESSTIQRLLNMEKEVKAMLLENQRKKRKKPVEEEDTTEGSDSEEELPKTVQRSKKKKKKKLTRPAEELPQRIRRKHNKNKESIFIYCDSGEAVAEAMVNANATDFVAITSAAEFAAWVDKRLGEDTVRARGFLEQIAEDNNIDLREAKKLSTIVNRMKSHFDILGE
jgi:hypothetical protein